MRQVKVLGTSCCGRGDALEELVRRASEQTGMAVDLQRIDDMRDIAAAGVMSTPALVIDGKLVHAGGLPDSERVAEWLSA